VTKEKEDELVRSLRFRASTGSSREEDKELMSTPVLMEGIIEEISTNNQWSAERAKTIFELLIPNDFKEQLKRHGNINWILDAYTASYPWELLQDGLTDTKPICISAGMIRQLSTRNYRTTIKAVPKNTALIIADPDLKGFANQLPGALKEGQLVSELLADKGMNTTISFKGNHSEIIEKLFRDDYKIIHLSGHGIFNKDVLKGSGMVIGKNLFLSTREIQQMSSVPELVFVNCCHLGKTDGVAEEFYRERYKLAANIGTQLIENGVRCVIAAGWAVNDEAALEFANVFYKRMFDGYNFGDSVKEARIAVYDKFGHTNTWGAYQCYGDPFYKFDTIHGRKKSAEKTYLIAQEAEVELMNLLHELEIGKLPSQEYLKKLDLISEAVEKAAIRNAVITEKEALICLELGEYDRACEKFSSLLTMEEASFSFSVAEKYCNARSKNIIKQFRKVPQNKAEYLKKIGKVIDDLEILIDLSPTSERLNIIGSTYKRQAFLSGKTLKAKAYLKAAESYHRGYTNFNNWYSLTNWLIIESTLIRAGLRNWSTDLDKEGKPIGYIIPSLEESLRLLEVSRISMTQNEERMSYWDMLACLNIRLCKFILLFSESDSRTDLDNIIQEITTLWKIAGSKGKRFAEIEHLEFIIDALSVNENTQTLPLKNRLIQMKDELVKLI
jgi:tetratricopeptide (TPR) repeat protein